MSGREGIGSLCTKIGNAHFHRRWRSVERGEKTEMIHASHSRDYDIKTFLSTFLVGMFVFSISCI